MTAGLLPIERALTPEILQARVRASLGRAPADVVLANCRLLNVYSEETHPADIAIQGGAVVAIRDGYDGEATRRIDCRRLLVVPGLVQPRIELAGGRAADLAAATLAEMLAAGTTAMFADDLPTVAESGPRLLQAGARDGVIVSTACQTADAVLATIRQGEIAVLTAESQEALAALLADLVSRRIDLRHVCLSGLPAVGLTLLGAVALAAGAGVSPVRAVQMATLHPATHEGLDHLIGSVTPGCRADILVLNEVTSTTPELAIVEGAVVFER